MIPPSATLRLCVRILGTCVALAALSRQASAAELKEAIGPLVDGHQGKVAVAIKCLETGEEYRHNADVPMPTASLIKLPVMVAAYQAMADDKLSADQMITLAKEDKVPGSGILTSHFSAGVQLSLNDAIHLMIVHSDNTATNLVVDQIGLPTTAALMNKLGYPETRLNSKVFRGDTTLDPQRSKLYGLGSTTADDMADLLEKIAAGQIVDKASCDRMLGHLRANEGRTTIPRFLPPGTVVAHKTGSVAAVRTDAGIIESPAGPLVVCVLTAENEDLRWTDDNAAELLIAKIAEAAYRHFVPVDPVADEPGGLLRVGASGKLVEALQRTLNAKLQPPPELSADGDFGPMTERALKAFQKEQGLAESGETTPETWAALGTLVTAGPPAPEPAEFNARPLDRQPADPLDGPPLVTCAAWAIGDGATGQLLHGGNENARREVASTTKIMTAYLVYRYAAKHPEILDETIVFSKRADETEGSTAAVEAGESLPVRELMYGLLLPSGNDASVALAEHFGDRIAAEWGAGEHEHDGVPEQEHEQEAGGGGESAAAAKDAAQQSYDHFLAAMNQAAQSLGMTSTRYVNPHGLPSDEHGSTAADMLKLAHATFQFPEFARVVGARQHGCKLNGPGGYQRNIAWYNTNRLLEIEGFDGMKTGTTNNAGCCLVSHGTRDGKSLYVVVLGATSTDARYSDSRNLYRWAWGK